MPRDTDHPSSDRPAAEQSTRSKLFASWPVFFLGASMGVLVALPSAGQMAQQGSPPPDTQATPWAEAAGPSAPMDTEETTSETAPLGTEPGGSGIEPLAPRLARWLEEVEPLISGPELRLFRSLRKNYQRDAFVEQFWRVRDPYPQTARNELKERWPLRVAEARSQYSTLRDDRSRVLLIHGPPQAKLSVRCTTTRIPAEVWGYSGSDQVSFNFALVFLRPGGEGEARIWRPLSSSSSMDAVIARARPCINGSQLTQVVNQLRAQGDRYESLVASALAKPKPRSREWLQTFVAHSTDLRPEESSMPAIVDMGFPGRHQSRTVVQGLIRVPTDEVQPASFAGYSSYDFQLTGEVVIEDRLFESFRYKFGVPVTEDLPPFLPLSFQRLLRPGTYSLVLKLDDLNSDLAFREVMTLVVPAMDQVVEMPTYQDEETARLFEEATAAISAGETTLRLIPPQGELLTGFVRFDTLVAGTEIEKVRFYLDEQAVVTRNRPPFEVSLDLGPFPDLHSLRAVGLNGEGREVASDEILLNTGGYRFYLKLVEPRKGVRYEGSLRVRAEVEVPEGRSLERLEVYLNESLVATLYQEPFVQPVVLPEGQEISYIRAVAYLPDGNSTEDVAFINAPDYLEEVEVQYVELYTSAFDRQGRPVTDLSAEDFQVEEDGVGQTVRRFEKVENLPIHMGILLDNSASMVGVLDDVRKAALGFFQQSIRPRDRAAVITFNSFPNLAVKLTNDRQQLGAGLAGLVPEGKTALYDSVMFALYYFTGIRGQRSLLLLSDGQDESSRFDFEQTLEYARRAGITIYAIGLRLNSSDARGKLQQLADETGGRSFFIRDIGELEAIYKRIEEELRSQYLLAYQSTNTSDDGEFRSIELSCRRPGIEVKTLSGYYP